MARIARVIAKGYPHHVTQCGKRRRPKARLWVSPDNPQIVPGNQDASVGVGGYLPLGAAFSSSFEDETWRNRYRTLPSVAFGEVMPPMRMPLSSGARTVVRNV